MESSIIRLAHCFMAQSRYAVVPSMSKEGHPQSALVGMAVTPDLEIIFDTVKSSRKYPNLMKNPLCSAVVLGSGETTVQLDGTAAEPHGAEQQRYQEIYFAAWPECRAHSTWPDIAYLVMRPGWIRYSNYDQTPPLIEEVELRSANGTESSICTVPKSFLAGMTVCHMSQPASSACTLKNRKHEVPAHE